MTGQDGTSASPGEPGVTGDLFSPACPTRQLLDRIGDKWTSMLIKVLAEAHPEELGFAQVKNQLSGLEAEQVDALKERIKKGPKPGASAAPPVPPTRPRAPSRGRARASSRRPRESAVRRAQECAAESRTTSTHRTRGRRPAR